MTFLIVAAAIATVGMPFVLLARRTFALDRVIAQWPRAPGVITVSTVESGTSRQRDEAGYDIVRTVYRPIVHYTYAVAGQQLESHHIGRVDYWTGRVDAQEILDRYPVHKQVEVLYDPADPRTAYLETKRSTGAVILLVMGCFFFALAALFVLLALVT